MCHLIICKSLISKDDAATKGWYHLSLGITSLYDICMCMHAVHV